MISETSFHPRSGEPDGPQEHYRIRVSRRPFGYFSTADIRLTGRNLDHRVVVFLNLKDTFEVIFPEPTPEETVAQYVKAHDIAREVPA